jgi:hypothetical protein
VSGEVGYLAAVDYTCAGRRGNAKVINSTGCCDLLDLQMAGISQISAVHTVRLAILFNYSSTC